MGVEWKKTSCYNCGVCCGLEVQIKDNQIVNVRPDKASMRSLGGYCCRKGRALKYFQHNKNRLDYPLKRVGDEFVRISWDQALSEIGEKVREIKSKYSPKAFGFYGVGLAVDQVPMFPLHDLKDLLGSQWAFNPLSVEFLSPWWAGGKLLGKQFPPIEGGAFESEVFICWGANTYVSHNVGNARLAIKDASENPNRMFIVVDPCLSETARMADMHIMPKSGTDALLIRAIISIILQNGWEDKEYIEKYTTGWEQSRKWFENFDVDKALNVCRVPKDQIMGFTRILCTKKWGVHPDLGLFFGRHATLSCYLLDLLMAVTGNLFKTGTNNIANDYISWGKYTDENTPGTWRTWKTNSFPTLSYYGSCALQECMEDPNENDRLRSLFVVAGNPARSWPDTQVLIKDFKNLDLMVVIDIAMTETCRCADYVLPGTTGYERFGTTIFTGGYPYSTLTFKQQLLEPEAERKDDSEILLNIIEASGLLPEIPQYLYDIAEEGIRNNDRMAIIQPVDQFLSEVNREECRKPVLYKIMGKAMKSVSKAAFWVNFIYGDLSVENAMRVGYACPHVHPEMENDPEKLPLIIRDQVFDAIDRSPSGNVIAGAQGTIEGQLKDHVTYPDKKVHLYDETVDRFIGNITPEKEAECIALTEEYRTNTEELRRNRKLTLQMIMAHHPVDCHHCLRIGSSKEEDLDPKFCEMCFFCDCVRDGICELQQLNREYHVDALPFEVEGCRYDVDDSLHSVVRDQNKCVKCRRCIEVCNDIQSIHNLALFGRGQEYRVTASMNKSMSESLCVRCGRCVDVCPTGALHKIGVDCVISEEEAINASKKEAEELILNSDGPIVISNSHAVRNFVDSNFSDIADCVHYYKSVQESFASIAKSIARKLGYDRNTWKTIVFTANNENGSEAKERETVDFSMNAREIYRTFKRTGVDLRRIAPADALKFEIDPDCIFGKVTGPVSFNYEAEPEMLKIDGKNIAVAHNLGQARRLLEEVRNGISRFDIIRLCA